MKKTALFAGAMMLLFSVTAIAQDGEKKPDVWQASKNPTVDSITSKYSYTAKPAVALTPDKIFPALGNYDVNENAGQSISRVAITLDEQNKGIVWIDGLGTGKIKAVLKKSPATYKIPAQKTEDGKDVAEGTLMYDKESNTLSICIGKPYNDMEPGAAFAMQEPVAETKPATSKKVKVARIKVLQYTGKKVEETSMGSANLN